MKNKLNFCCGNDIRGGWDNCDIQRKKGIIYCDADTFPYPFEDNTYSFIEVKQCLQCILYPRRALLELWKIAKNNAVISIETAYYNNKGAFTDLDTLHYFNDQSFITFVENNCRVDNKEMFIIKKLYREPSWFGAIFIFEFIRSPLSLSFLMECISECLLNLRLLKKQIKQIRLICGSYGGRNNK